MARKPKITVQSGIPLPNPDSPRGRSIYPWREMSVGDSFFVKGDPNKKNPISGGAVGSAARRLGVKFAMRYVTERGQKGIRVWRVK